MMTQCVYSKNFGFSNNEINKLLTKSYEAILFELKAAKRGIGLSAIKGVGKSTANNLEQVGFNTIEAIVNASVEDLTKIYGIGKIKPEKFIKRANKLE